MISLANLGSKLIPILLMTLLVALAGCGTSSNVQELTKLTSDNVNKLSAQLKKLETASQRVARQRAENLAELEVRVDERRARALTRRSTFQIISDPRAKLVVRLLESFDEIAAAQRLANRRARDRIAGHLSAREPLNPDTKALNAVAVELAKLAEEPSLGDQLQFYKDFFSTSLDTIESALGNGEDAAADAVDASNAAAEVATSGT